MRDKGVELFGSDANPSIRSTETPDKERGKEGKKRKERTREKKTKKMSNAVPNAGKEINVGSSQG